MACPGPRTASIDLISRPVLIDAGPPKYQAELRVLGSSSVPVLGCPCSPRFKAYPCHPRLQACPSDKPAPLGPGSRPVSMIPIIRLALRTLH